MVHKHIVHLIFSLQTGGAENLMIDMANAQCAYHKVSVIIINDKYETEMVRQINPSIQLSFLNRKKGSKNWYKIFTLNKFLFQLKPDIIHCHNQNAISVLLFYRKRTVYTIHDVGVSIKYFAKYRKLVAISKAVYDDVVQRTNAQIIPIIINNSISIDDIVVKQKFQLQHPIKIVQVSRLEHEKKGQDILLYAIAELVQKHKLSPIKISFIGTGKSLNFLQQLTKELQLNDNVEFLENKTRTDIFNQLHTYDVLVQPSRYEGFGLTILEAMAAKVPVIASNIDGPAIIIDKNKYGYLFEKDNSHNLASVIEQVIEDYNCNAIENKVLLARERVKKEYSMPTLLSKYEEMYSKIT